MQKNIPIKCRNITVKVPWKKKPIKINPLQNAPLMANINSIPNHLLYFAKFPYSKSKTNNFNQFYF